MNEQTKSYHQTIEKIQKSMRRIDQQLQRSSMFTQEFTIKNQTDRNLDVVIKLQEEIDKFQIGRSQSRVSIPKHTTYKHRISTSRQKPNERSQNTDHISKSLKKASYEQHFDPQQSQQKRNGYKMRQQQLRERLQQSPVRLQKSFQPLSRMKSKNKQSLTQFLKQYLVQSGVQTELDVSQNFSNFSEVKQEWQSAQPNALYQSKKAASIQTPRYKTQLQTQQNTIQSMDRRIIQEKHLQLQFPISDFQNKIDSLFGKIQNQSEYQLQVNLKGQDSNILIYQDPFNISFNQLQTTEKVQSQKKENKHPKMQSLGLGYKNHKKYFQISSQRKLFKIAKQKQRQSRLGLNTSRKTQPETNRKISSRSKHKEKNIFGQNQSNKRKVQQTEPQDIFLQRQGLLLHTIPKFIQSQKKIQHVKPAARSPAKYSYISQFTYKNISQQEKKKHQISAKALEVSERLYSRSKGKLKPCEHYQRFSEPIQRQRFQQLLRENSFVSSRMTQYEKQIVFQSLRRSNDSVSTWPFKLLNYTYSKFQKVPVYKRSKNKALT